MGADVRDCIDRVVSAEYDAGRAESTIQAHRVVLDRFADFMDERGLDQASDLVCIDFIANETGVRLGSLRESVEDRAVTAVRRPVVLLAEALVGRVLDVGRAVISTKDPCPPRFSPVRQEYLLWCRGRGNAEATVKTKGGRVSQFLDYLDQVGVDDFSAVGVPELSGFFIRQQGAGKSQALIRTVVADFLGFLAVTGRTEHNLADRLPPYRHVRHESEPHLWTAGEIRAVLAAIDRASAIGKRDYAMILATARLGLRISDLRNLELGDLNWRAKTITIVQHKTGRPLSLPLLDDVGWAIIDYVRGGRPDTDCPKVFVKHRHPFDSFGAASSLTTRLSRHAARAGIEFPPGQLCGMHSLRSALAVAMISNDTPIPVVSAVLGHASSDTTAAYYLRFDVERLRCCALDVEDLTDINEAGVRDA